jgi:hypothetical protein
MPCLSHSHIFDHFDNILWRIQVMKVFISFLSPVTSSLLDPNILLSSPFSNTVSLCSSHGVTYQIPHLYKTSRWQGGIFWTDDSKHSSNWMCSQFFYDVILRHWFLVWTARDMWPKALKCTQTRLKLQIFNEFHPWEDSFGKRWSGLTLIFIHFPSFALLSIVELRQDQEFFISSVPAWVMFAEYNYTLQDERMLDRHLGLSH